MRSGQSHFSLSEDTLSSEYSPVSGVTIESTVIPCSSWHIRIHKITNTIPIDVADGGFAISQENCFQIEVGRNTGRYEEKDVKTDENSVFAKFPWGISGMVSETGQTPDLVPAFPNTNLFYNLTVIPVIKGSFEAGVHFMVTSVFADRSFEAEALMEEKPEVKIEDSQVKIISKGKTVTVLCQKDWSKEGRQP